MNSPLLCLTAVAVVIAGKPTFFSNRICFIRLSLAANDWMVSALPSDEPSSTMKNSKSVKVCVLTLRIALARCPDEFRQNVGIRTETRGIKQVSCLCWGRKTVPFPAESVKAQPALCVLLCGVFGVVLLLGGCPCLGVCVL